MKLAKGLLALVTILVVTMVAFAALADTLTIDLDTATLEELEGAKGQIAERITALQKEAAPAADEAQVLTGSGTDIKTNVAIEAIPARITVNGTVSVKLSGKYDHTFNYSKDAWDMGVLTEAGTFTVLVEGEGDWTVTIEALKAGGEIEVSGSGPYVGDFFLLDGPKIVTISADSAKMDAIISNVIINLEYKSRYDMFLSDGLSNELLSAGKQFTADVIANPPEGGSGFFWSVDVSPGVEWSIELK